MVRVRADWVKRQANQELDRYLQQRVWHWAVRRNFALAADYAIRILNRHPRDPLALLLGEVAAAETHQDVFAEKCREAQRRLCFTKDVGDVADLLSPHRQSQARRSAGPSQEEVKAFMESFHAESATRAAAGAVETGREDEQISVMESEPFAESQTAVRRASQRAAPQQPLCELLDPQGSLYGRGLYATQRIPPRTALLVDEPVLVQRMDEDKCAHCLAPLHGHSGGTGRRGDEISCPHCGEETYCSTACQEAAWQQYHACGCRSVNPPFADWAAAMKETLYSGSAEDGVANATSPPRAALSCLAVGKVCAMATVQQVHPLALHGIRRLRGIADYEPATALSEIGALAVSLSAMLRQPFLHMEEVLSLFAVLQSNEFLLPGGVALYPVCSLLNHSCDPNCAVVPASPSAAGSTKRVVTALRDIRDGEQLFIDYNSHLTSKLDYEQRKALCAQRHFECFCAKCVRRQ